MTVSKIVSKKRRLDEIILDRKLCDSIKQAQAYVYSGLVHSESRLFSKPGELISVKEKIFVKKIKKYVSRGGDKLKFAIDYFNLSGKIQNKTILDVGASSGGFTDCLLSFGAKKVIALDVGYNQLNWKLKIDPRVCSLEQTDIRNYNSNGLVNFLVADISFNSISFLIKDLIRVFDEKNQIQMVLLIKPQFELEKSEIPKGGIVYQDSLRLKALNKVIESFSNYGQFSYQTVDSILPGRKGNREIFIYLKSL
ncbi:MAG: TlyA family rRNA (cytidine-2'-O)-methyltransferase [Zetaproteobacteria bacterium]|nr:TlyA family rRNA (cytidine-2'-O)-methyltransferase [Pseudobdellovibrionaceae bacterium]|tara:strand:- start:1822 stop:2577 length:756 start_codon:yes stop_codon:yes gene_type:complete